MQVVIYDALLNMFEYINEHKKLLKINIFFASMQVVIYDALLNMFEYINEHKKLLKINIFFAWP